MSIASEISRLSSNISDSLDAVAAKGVTVPSDSNSDDLPGLIALIGQGSGGDSGGTIYQDTDGYLHLSEDDKNVISIVDTLDTAGGTIRTITSKVDSGGISIDDIATGAEPSGKITLSASVTSIAKYAFAGKKIESISGVGVSSIDNRAFLGSSLTSVIFPNVETVNSEAFDDSTVSEINFPKCKTAVSVKNNSEIKRIYIGGAGNISGNYWIQNCPSLIEVRAPNATLFSPNGFGFSGDVSLNILDIGFSPFLYSSSLPSTAPLSVIIMRKNNSLVNLQNGANSLNSLAFAEGGTGGTIYIPEVLYNHLGDGSSLDYKAATNWSTLDARGTVTWAKIEGSEYE